MIKKHFLRNAALITLVSASGCLDIKDVYDENFTKDNFIVSDVPAGFDWSSLNTIELSVIPYEQFNGRYSSVIEVFTDNPITESSPNLIASGVGRKDNPLNVTLEVPATTSLVYVRLTTPDGHKQTVQIDINGKKHISYTFENPNASYTESQEAAVMASTRNHIVDFSIPADAIEIIQGSDLFPWTPSGASYVLNSGEYVSGSLRFNAGDKLYIAGKLDCYDGFSLQNLGAIYVLEGGELNILSRNSNNYEISNNSFIAIQSGGTLTTTDGIQLKITNQSGNLYNYGDIQVSNLILASGANLYNNSKAYFKSLESLGNGTKIINNGTFESDYIMLANVSLFENNANFKAGSLSFDNVKTDNNSKLIIENNAQFLNSTINNNCYIGSDNLELKGTRITNSGNCAIVCETMTLDGGQLTLRPGSLIDVRVSTVSTSYSKDIYGGESGEGYALFRTPKMDFQGWMATNFRKNVQFECSNYNANTQYQFYYTTEESVQFVAEGESNIVIEQSECTTGNTVEPSEPNEPEYPVIEENNSIYTFLMEDNFPRLGDYDMNDLVVTLNKRETYKNADNLVEKTEIHFKLSAIGASRRLGFALQLDKVSKDNIKSAQVEGSIITGGMFDISNGLENGQNITVIPVFDDAHKVFSIDYATMANTSNATTKYECKEFVISIEFYNPVSDTDVNIDALNFFVAQTPENNKRIEIHLPGHKQSDKSGVSKQVLDSTADLMWALLVPGKFAYPTESHNIKASYPKFENWVKSNKTQDTDWYEHPTSEKDYVYTRYSIF